jgi:hypothetical protein
VDTDARGGKGGERMGDLVYVGLTVIFFGLSWALVGFCDRL